MAVGDKGDVALVPTEVASPGSQRTERTESGVPRTIATLDRGSSVGRYLILDVLGAGGMGVVYSAYDPELDRKVAIKLMQTNPGGSSGEGAWLLREAQALAKLAHPNVVAVYDVGTLSDDRVFLAMELVEGKTLREWLEVEVRSWREVVAVMLAAGAGLAAAHAVGLVHRDFKPENVVVGSDGRVRVMDFGLARLRRDEEPPPRLSDLAIESKSPLSDQLTVAGTVIGTPAYMAPEIHEGHVADARTDQFSFGVTLYEALYRHLPFDRAALRDGIATMPKPPLDVAPARIQRVVMRAIALDHAARFASMDALMRELERDPWAKRRRVLLLAGAPIAVVAAVGLTFAFARSASPVCRGADRRLDGIWDAPTKAAVRRAYLATHLPIAERSYAALERALDRYAQSWVKSSTESCEATRVRRDQTEEALGLRQACLDHRLLELAAVTKLLSTDPSPEVVLKGDGITTALESIGRCDDVEALRQPDRAPPGPLSAQLDADLAKARAEMIAGHYLPTLVMTKKIIEGAERIGYRSLAADAHNLRGAALMTTQNVDESIAEFIEGTRLGLTSRRDDIAANSAFEVANLTASLARRPREAKVWLAVGEAIAARISDPFVEMVRYNAKGIVAAENGDPVTAVAAHQKMYDITVANRGESFALLNAEQTLATTMVRAQAYAKAAAMYERVLADQEKLYGPEQPDVAIALSNLGICYGKLGNMAKTRATFERTIALRERLFGKTNPLLVPALDNYASALGDHGFVDEGLALIERAKQLSAAMDSDNSTLHTVLTTRSELLGRAGRSAEAHAAFAEVIALEEKAHSPILPETLAKRAELAFTERQWRDAASFAERSVAAYEADGGSDNPDLWAPLSLLGRARAELAELPAARAALERSLALAGKTELPAETLAPTRDALQRVRQ